jgi:hypothetical protein
MQIENYEIAGCIWRFIYSDPLTIIKGPYWCFIYSLICQKIAKHSYILDGGSI